MKNVYKKSLSVIAFILLLTSCGSDDSAPVVEPAPAPAPSGSYIKGKVNGVQFENLQIMGVSTAVATRSGTGDGTLIMLSGSDMETNTMVITTYGITTTGTYTVNSEDDGTVLAYIPSNEVSYDTSDCEGATGTLVITHLDDTKIEGTFSFTGKDDENCGDSRVISEGSFRGVFMR